MKLKTGYIIRQILDDYIVVPTGSAALDFNGMIRLNKTSAFLWELLKEDTTAEALTQQLTAHYEVSEKQAAESVSRFLDKLQEQELLVQ